MPEFDLTSELSLKIELHMLRPITEKVYSGNGPVSLVHRIHTAAFIALNLTTDLLKGNHTVENIDSLVLHPPHLTDSSFAALFERAPYGDYFSILLLLVNLHVLLQVWTLLEWNLNLAKRMSKLILKFTNKAVLNLSCPFAPGDR